MRTSICCGWTSGRLPEDAQARAEVLLDAGRIDPSDGRRRDLTHLNLFTIDGQSPWISTMP